jgi:hypothetical protein
MKRSYVTMPVELKRRAQARAAEQGVSLSGYVRRLVVQDLGPPRDGPKPDISIIFNLIDEGPPTNIARDKDKLIGEAVWREHLRKIGKAPRRRGK